MVSTLLASQQEDFLPNNIIEKDILAQELVISLSLPLLVHLEALFCILAEMAAMASALLLTGAQGVPGEAEEGGEDLHSPAGEGRPLIINVVTPIS